MNSTNILLIIGFFFPMLSWTTFIISSLIYNKTGRNTSAVLIPILGPILISFWIYLNDLEWWVYLLPWILDIGTIAFIYSMFYLLKEDFKHAKFNNFLTLSSTKDSQTTTLLLQKKNICLCRFNWEKRTEGIIACNDFGTYEINDQTILLHSHIGHTRYLKKNDNNYICKDNLPNDEHMNLDNYIFMVEK